MRVWVEDTLVPSPGKALGAEIDVALGWGEECLLCKGCGVCQVLINIKIADMSCSNGIEQGNWCVPVCKPVCGSLDWKITPNADKDGTFPVLG